MTEMTACREAFEKKVDEWCAAIAANGSLSAIAAAEIKAAWNTRPDSGEAQPFGWWIELRGEGFGQFVRDQYFMSHLKDAGFVIAETPVYTRPPTASPDLSTLTALVGKWQRLRDKLPPLSLVGITWGHAADELQAALTQVGIG